MIPNRNSPMDPEILKEYNDWEEKKLQEHGFIIHCVPRQAHEPKGDWDIMDTHTHGVTEKWDHPELQIISALGVFAPDQLGQIIHNAVNQIKEGVTFTPGQEYANILGNGYKIGVFRPKEGVARIIFPDKKGNTNSQEPLYKLQREVRITP